LVKESILSLWVYRLMAGALMLWTVLLAWSRNCLCITLS